MLIDGKHKSNLIYTKKIVFSILNLESQYTNYTKHINLHGDYNNVYNFAVETLIEQKQNKEPNYIFYSLI